MTASRKFERKEQQSLTHQDDLIKYEQAYHLNHLELLDTTELVKIVAVVLEEILKRTDKIINSFPSKFNTKYPIRVHISSFLIKMIETFQCSQECLILSMIYIDRLTKNETRLIIQSKNIHRLELSYFS